MTTELAAAYATTLSALLLLAILLFVQFIVADVAGIRNKHIPGMPVTGGHSSFFFRAVRAHANSNENLPLFILSVLLCVWLGADPKWTGVLVWTFVAGRLGHMLCYYFDLRLPRSGFFVIGTIAQVGLLVVAVMAWLAGPANS